MRWGTSSSTNPPSPAESFAICAAAERIVEERERRRKLGFLGVRRREGLCLIGYGRRGEEVRAAVTAAMAGKKGRGGGGGGKEDRAAVHLTHFIRWGLVGPPWA